MAEIGRVGRPLGCALRRALVIGAGVVLVAACAPTPGAVECVSSPQRDGRILVAGSGVWDALAATVTSAEDPAAVMLTESIGSGGALRALADGAIDIGLLSRPPKEHERPPGLLVIAAGTSRLLFRAPAGADLVALYGGGKAPTYGRVPRLFVREPGDSGWDVLRKSDPLLHDAMRLAAAEGRAEIAWTDREMRRLLTSAPGAVGPLDQSLWPARLAASTMDRGLRKSLFVVIDRQAPPPVHKLAEKLAKEAVRAGR